MDKVEEKNSPTDKDVIFKIIINKYTKAEVYERINKAKLKYIKDWGNKFANIHEAYEKQGCGRAERQIIREIIAGSGVQELNVFILVELIFDLLEHYNLSLN